MKNHILSITPLFLIYICFYSCKSDSKNLELKTIDVSSDTFKREEVKLSDIASSIEYVFFETNQKSIFASYRGIKVSQNFILVNDDTKNRLLLFNRQGRFLREISRYGKGPGEFVSIAGITLNEHDNRIIINSPFQRKLIFFSIDGNFIREEIVNYPIHYLNDFSNSILLGTHFPVQFGTDHFNLHFIDEDGNQISRQLPRPLKELRQPYEIAFNNRYSYYDTLCIWDGCFDTIYGVSHDLKVTPRWRIINSDKYIGYEGFMTGKVDVLWRNGKYYIGKILETSNYFFIDYSREHKYHTLLLDKPSGKISDATLKNPSINYGVGLNNDLDGGYPFWPAGTCDEKTLFTTLNVYEMKEYLMNYCDTLNNSIKIKLSILKKHIETMTDIDNPILIFVKTK